MPTSAAEALDCFWFQRVGSQRNRGMAFAPGEHAQVSTGLGDSLPAADQEDKRDDYR